MYLNRFEVWLCFIWYTVYKSAQTALVYNALQQIYSWMTANLLTLNSSKTEFLLIGLKKQLDKIHNSSLNTTHSSARNLGFIFDKHLTFSDQISAICKACYYQSDSFVVSVLTLIPTQLAPLPPPSFTPNSITVIRSITTYLSLRLLASNRFRTLLPVLLSKLLNPEPFSNRSWHSVVGHIGTVL